MLDSSFFEDPFFEDLFSEDLSEMFQQSTKNDECPFNSTDWDDASYQPSSGNRAKRDLKSLLADPVPNVFFASNEENFMCIQAMIIGNFDTPYEGGFFHFYIRCGPRYPAEPPRVSAMSCFKFGQTVRFNPTMYTNGRVCLSILGTWEGPAWTSDNNLTGVLHGLQSLLSDQPLCGEACFEHLRDTGSKKVWEYDLYVRHETLRVAVLHTIKQAKENNVPAELTEIMKSSFLEYYDSYIISCNDNMKYDGTSHDIELFEYSTCFVPNFANIKIELIKLHQQLKAEEISLVSIIQKEK